MSSNRYFPMFSIMLVLLSIAAVSYTAVSVAADDSSSDSLAEAGLSLIALRNDTLDTNQDGDNDAIRVVVVFNTEQDSTNLELRLIGEYKDGFTIIAENLMEDRDRFYPFLNPNLVKIDVYIAFFVFIFLIVLYSSNFYSYVNELSFSLNERLLDEFISIYLLWTSSLLIFFQIFRFTTISRLYVLGLTFIIPVILLFFRNSEFMSSLLGRNPSKETVLLINIDNSSQFREMRLLKFRKVVSEVNFKDNLENRIIEYTENLFKSENINLIVINLDNVSELSSNFEK